LRRLLAVTVVAVLVAAVGGANAAPLAPKPQGGPNSTCTENVNGWTLHPNGFGEDTYASWKGQEGLPDCTGGANQAFYLQKMTPTAAPVAAVAVIDGVADLSTEGLSLEFWWQTDGHCGAGAPRFNVGLDVAGTAQTFFVGCQMMQSGDTATDDQGDEWEQRTYNGPWPPSSTVTSLAIVFDEGNDVGPGFVYLDNIRVNGHTWTSPSDNASN
jgi:hypothetical protein